MKRIDHVREMYDEEIVKIKHPELWQHTLACIGKYYKFNFVEALLIHAQAEELTTLQTMEIWNKYGRYIRKGEHSTAVFTSRNDTKLKYLFDISQTYGKPIIGRWDLRKHEEHREALVQGYNQKHATDHKEIRDVLDEVYRTAVNDMASKINTEIDACNPQIADTVKRLVKDSAFVIMMSRCGYEIPEGLLDFSAISEVVPDSLLILAGNLAMETAHNALMEIENIIRRNDHEHSTERNRDRIRGEGRTVLPEAGRTQRESGAEHNGEESGGSSGQYIRNGAGRSEYKRTGRQDLGGNSGTGDRQVGGSKADAEQNPAESGELERERKKKYENVGGSGQRSGRTDVSAGEAYVRGNNETAPFIRRSGMAAAVKEKTDNSEESSDDGSFSYAFNNVEEGEALVKIMFSESDELQSGQIMSLAEADVRLGELNEQCKAELGYYKTFFTLRAKLNGEEYEYKGRYDIGSDSETLTKHIMAASGEDSEIAEILNGISGENEEAEKESKKEEIDEVISFIPANEERYLQETFFADDTADFADEKNEINFTQEEKEKQYVTEKVAEYPAEKIELPYDVVVETIHTNETIIKDKEEEETPDEIAKAEIAVYKKNFRLAENEKIDYAKGEKAKYHDNVTAIRTLRKIEKEKRFATQEEQKILAKYTGWGGLSKAFDKNAESWQKEYIELKALLSEKEYEAALESTLTAYYTDPDLIRPIYETLERFGFKGGDILDMYCQSLIQCHPREGAEKCLKYRLSADFSNQPKALFFCAVQSAA